ncbi:unnamed protein product [Brassica rapa]|uniref:Uncharacterized protein n=1 Tax=Brassica campestris TaxID=3711 RepID=A0A8D9H7J1_BRACM|nr:unnamed protein product [Brassica rapa]
MISGYETMVYQRVGGMQTSRSFTTQLQKQPIEASREDFNRIIAKIDVMLSKLLPKDMISSIQRQDSNQNLSITPNDATNLTKNYSCCRENQTFVIIKYHTQNKKKKTSYLSEVLM